MQKLFHTILVLASLGPSMQVTPALAQIMGHQVMDLNVGKETNVSNNWAGYVTTGGSFTSVIGSWIVPQVNPTGTSADATWVGIGGMAHRDLIQTGTQAIVNNNGMTSYQAWYEMLPANSHKIPLSINPGDSVTASIVSQSEGQWTISMRDDTTGQNYQTTVTYASSLSSAEWIEEMPVRGRYFIPLDNFGSVQFSALSTVKDGTTLTPSQAGAHPMVMDNYRGQVLALPSALGSDGASFTVNRTGSMPTPVSGVITGVHGHGRQPLYRQGHGRGRFGRGGGGFERLKKQLG
jgi:hypothetical protein